MANVAKFVTKNWHKVAGLERTSVEALIEAVT
jgi:hypothetical protein